jgi:MarR family transcriptional regulator, 2-MHQ and catechol-resistance regulon repressor
MMSGEAGGFAMGTHYQGHPAEVRALDALVKLVRCTASVQGRLEVGIREEGFTPSQFGVLEALLHLGPLEPCELGPKVLTSRPNMVLLIDQLEGRGLVRRVPVAGDRRRLRVELTPAGRRTIAKAFQRHLQRVVKELSALSAAEQEQLGRLCKRLGRQEAEAARSQTA